MPGAGVPTGMAVLISGKGSPRPPGHAEGGQFRVWWWGAAVPWCCALEQGHTDPGDRAAGYGPTQGLLTQTTKEIVCFFNGFGLRAQLGRER